MFISVFEKFFDQQLKLSLWHDHSRIRVRRARENKLYSPGKIAMLQTRPIGVLLLGPTGSGKTPLGESLSTQGFDGWQFYHFDFGHQLRTIVSGSCPSRLFDDKERQLIAEILNTGRLLTNEEFYIADRLLRSFVSQLPQASGREKIIVLNGLPRNIFQAKRVADIVTMKLVVILDCDQEVVFRRIESNSGGDRIGRHDDDLDLVRRKYTLYEQETKPLRDFYTDFGVPIVELPVIASSTAEELRSLFFHRWRELW